MRAGTYDENIVVNKTLNLWALADYKKAVINGDNVTGTVVVEANNVTVVGFNITSELPGSPRGIHLKSCSGVKITGNVIDAGLGNGILVEGGAGNSIVNNWIEPCCYHGIELAGSNSNLIMGNWMNTHGDAIFVEGSNFNHIFRNTLYFHWVPFSVLWLKLSNNNIVEENILEAQGGYPEWSLYLSDAQNNTFFHNNICLPEDVGISGDCTNNSWDNGLEGNYWSSYNGTDLDGDGVGDTYLPWKGVDNCPLMKRYSWWNAADVNQDLKVDIFDVVMFAGCYGSTVMDSDWDFLFDIAEPYGKIEIFDIVKAAANYGKKSTP